MILHRLKQKHQQYNYTKGDKDSRKIQWAPSMLQHVQRFQYEITLRACIPDSDYVFKMG